MPISDLTGTTWVFNNSLNISDMFSYYINFTTNGEQKTDLYLEYRYNDYDDYVENDEMWYDSNKVYNMGTWYNDAYKTITITGGTDATNPDLIAWLESNATQQVAPTPSASMSIGNLSIDKAYFGNPEISAIYFGNVKVYEASSGPVIDPTFANNSWVDISTTFASGDAGNYWNVGDTKTDLGVDGYTRTLRISHIGSIYNKHGVIEEVNIEGTDGSGATGVVWNSSSNTDDDNAYNDYGISNMRTTVLPGVLTRLSNDLQAVITNTTYKVAKNGNSTTVLELEDKLFLPAEKEMTSSPTRARTEESAALTTWDYYTTHTSASDRIKYIADSTAQRYWLRSPRSGNTYSVVYVGNGGSFSGDYADVTNRLGFCFAL